MGDNPYDRVHPKESLSLELNFRSFLAGEGEAFLTPVPVEDMVSFASVGSPITIPASAPYSEDQLKEIARAVRQGRSTLTILGAAKYPRELLDALETEAPGHIRQA